MRYYDHFILPFTVGVIVLFTVVLYKYVRWFVHLPAEDKKRFRKGLFTTQTAKAVGEVFSESLLHRRIFRINPLLGYMHMSLAFGWFLLIVVGWIETSFHLGGEFAPLHTHIFFKYFFSDAGSTGIFPFLMDLFLLFVLSGVALAWGKRMHSKMMGMRRTTKHTTGDRIALSALWLIFPARLIAESVTSGLHQSGGFLTGSIGQGLDSLLSPEQLAALEPVAWWVYSIVLGVFFVAMPFSRYMHIFTEVPLIFLRRYGIGEEFRPIPTRGLFPVRHLHRPLPTATRCGDRPGAVGLFPARPSLRTSHPRSGRQLPDVRTLRSEMSRRDRTQYAAAQQSGAVPQHAGG